MLHYRMDEILFLEYKRGIPTFDMVIDQYGSQLVKELESIIRAKRIIASRDEYLNWVKAWKAGYAELSNAIRLAKSNRDNYKDTKFTREEWQSRAEIAGKLATRMLKMRVTAKELSGKKLPLIKLPKMPYFGGEIPRMPRFIV